MHFFLCPDQKNQTTGVKVTFDKDLHLTVMHRAICHNWLKQQIIDFSFGHMGAAEQAVNTTSTYHFKQLLWQVCWQTTAYFHIRQIRSDISVHLESFLWPPDC